MYLAGGTLTNNGTITTSAGGTALVIEGYEEDRARRQDWVWRVRESSICQRRVRIAIAVPKFQRYGNIIFANNRCPDGPKVAEAFTSAQPYLSFGSGASLVAQGASAISMDSGSGSAGLTINTTSGASYRQRRKLPDFSVLRNGLAIHEAANDEPLPAGCDSALRTLPGFFY